jgi:hypothetical protein
VTSFLKSNPFELGNAKLMPCLIKKQSRQSQGNSILPMSRLLKTIRINIYAMTKLLLKIEVNAFVAQMAVFKISPALPSFCQIVAFLIHFV